MWFLGVTWSITWCHLEWLILGATWALPGLFFWEGFFFASLELKLAFPKYLRSSNSNLRKELGTQVFRERKELRYFANTCVPQTQTFEKELHLEMSPGPALVLVMSLSYIPRHRRDNQGWVPMYQNSLNSTQATPP